MLQLDRETKQSVHSQQEIITLGGDMDATRRKNISDFLWGYIGLTVIVACIGWFVWEVVAGPRLYTVEATPTATLDSRPRVEKITDAYYPGAQVTLSGDVVAIVATSPEKYCTQLGIENRVYHLFGDLATKLDIHQFDLTLNAPKGGMAVHIVVSPETTARIDWTNGVFDTAWVLYDTKTLSDHMTLYGTCD